MKIHLTDWLYLLSVSVEREKLSQLSEQKLPCSEKVIDDTFGGDPEEGIQALNNLLSSSRLGNET